VNDYQFHVQAFSLKPILAVTNHNVSITYPSSLFSINLYKKTAKEILSNLQSAGEGHEWPPFLLNNIPGLCKSARTSQQ
jgi:hypothetical protein